MVNEYNYDPYPTPDSERDYEDWLDRYREIYPIIFNKILSAGG